MIGPVTFAFMTPPPGQGGSGALMVVFVQIAALVAIFWFLLLRPQRQQQKQHEELLKGLRKGDDIVTSGGIMGRVVHLADDRVTIQSAESRLVVERAKIAKVVGARADEAPAK